MDLVISNDKNSPIYEQIVYQLKQMILEGNLKEGETIPSIRALAKSLHISVTTVQKAYEELQENGFIDITKKGTLVCKK